VIIQAAGRFGCAHQYIATAAADGDRWLFVCDGCAHRTELLPLYRSASFGQLLAFPSPTDEAERGEAAFHRQPQSSLFQSA